MRRISQRTRVPPPLLPQLSELASVDRTGINDCHRYIEAIRKFEGQNAIPAGYLYNARAGSQLAHIKMSLEPFAENHGFVTCAHMWVQSTNCIAARFLSCFGFQCLPDQLIVVVVVTIMNLGQPFLIKQELRSIEVREG